MINHIESSTSQASASHEMHTELIVIHFKTKSSYLDDLHHRKLPLNKYLILKYEGTN